MRWVVRAGFEVKVFVEPQEIEEYREGARNANHENYLDITDQHFVDIGKNDQGLGYAKQFIKDYATEHGFDLVFKMDDDIKRWRWRGKNLPDDQMLYKFCEMVGICRITIGKYKDVAAIGFPYGNELFGKPKEWEAINARLQSCYLIRTEYLQGGYSTFEDFAQYIYIRSQNKVTLRYGLGGMDSIRVGSNRGGVPDV